MRHLTNQDQSVFTHLAIPVPLYTVELVTFHVIAALQDHILTKDGVRGQGGLCEADGGDQDPWRTSEVGYIHIISHDTEKEGVTRDH